MISLDIKKYSGKQTFLKNDNGIERLKREAHILIKGTTVEAKIVDIKQNQITISINGSLITGNTTQFIPASIGSIQNFDVSYDENGKLILLYKMPANDVIQKNAIADVLLSLGLKVNEENVKNAMLLIENNLGVNKENLQKINQGIKFFEDKSINKTLFFLENNLNISSKNADIFNSLINGENKILHQVESLLNSIKNSNESVQNRIYSILNTNNDIFYENKLISNLLTIISKNPQNIENAIMNHLNSISFNKQMQLKQILLQNFHSGKEVIENSFKENLDLVNLINESIVKLKSEITNEFNKSGFTYERLQNIINSITNVNIYKQDYMKNVLKYIFYNDQEMLSLLFNKLNNVNENFKLTQIEKKFIFNPTNTDSKNLNEFLSNLKVNVNDMLNEMNNINKEKDAKLIKDIINIKETLEFTSSIKNDTYIQIPISVNEHKLNSELYILRNKNKKNKKNTDVVSALICLDTKNIGRVEVLLQKNNKDVSLNFRLENNQTEELISENIKILNDKLKLFNYSVSNITFSELKQPFNLLERPLIEENENSIQKDSKFKFDLRM